MVSWLPNTGVMMILRPTQPGGINSVCPMSHSKYATDGTLFRNG